MGKLVLEGFNIDLMHNDRVNEIFDAYRIKLTGSLECRNEGDIYAFIYRELPMSLGEILLIMYQIGYEDGLKGCLTEDVSTLNYYTEGRN